MGKVPVVKVYPKSVEKYTKGSVFNKYQLDYCVWRYIVLLLVYAVIDIFPIAPVSPTCHYTTMSD